MEKFTLPAVNPRDTDSIHRYRQWQIEMSQQVVIADVADHVETVLGLDVQYEGQDRPAVAAAVVLSYPSLNVIEKRTITSVPQFPYVPGLLALRELPLLLELFDSLESKPDVVFCDGFGRAHPRGFGLASHLGLAKTVPVIGVAKNPPYRGRIPDPGPQRGDTVDLEPSPDWDEYNAEPVIGRSVRTRDEVKPIYVSVGHRITLDSAVDLVLGCTRGFRQPDPIRFADQLARAESKKLRE
ncbi:endonuclease V [Haloglycomyces albus]|uniref:endonuclease V n=1 Tax=Haloglycomyces albus TaxID=526067 RepID=UPI00046D0CDF|nr:endonuclease V [Haloglycomyces albus]